MSLTRRAVLTVVGIWLFVIATVVVMVALREAPADAVDMSGDGTPRHLSARWPASGLTHLKLTATDGNVTISAGETSEVEVSVEVRPARRQSSFFSKLRASGNPASATLSHHESDGRSAVRLDGANGPLEEHWTIRVPKHFAAEVDMADGRLSITGVEGGVWARANAGLGSTAGVMDVDVPGGALDLRLQVGTINATTGSTNHGAVDVRSDVGDARLSLAGRSIQAPREPGPGHRLRLDGDGPHALRVKVNVGDASLKIR